MSQEPVGVLKQNWHSVTSVFNDFVEDDQNKQLWHLYVSTGSNDVHL